MLDRYKYDVALSFAGERRRFVHKVYLNLKARGLKVFYDEDPDVQAEHIGERFSELSQMVYRSGAETVIMFISKEYVAKQWPVLESTHISDRLRQSLYRHDSGVYLADFDRTPLPGLAEEIWRAKIKGMTSAEFCNRYMRWRSKHATLRQNEVLLMLATSKFAEAIKSLSAMDLNSASQKDKVFVLYNLACAKAKLANQSKLDEPNLLDEAVSSLSDCIRAVEDGTPEHLQELLDFANEDDDLLYLRRQREAAVGSLLRRPTLNLDWTGRDHSSQSSCVDPEAVISTPRGGKKICDISVDDEVHCYSPLHKKNGIGKVTACRTFPMKERLSLNNALIVSLEQHLYHREKKWVRSATLKVGDAVMTGGGEFTEIHSIATLDRSDVMIISVDHPSHTFVANGLLCHNIEKP